MMSLSNAKAGNTYTIKWNFSCYDDFDSNYIGLTPGETVYLLSSYFGSVIIMLKGKKLALSSEVANRIKV